MNQLPKRKPGFQDPRENQTLIRCLAVLAVLFYGDPSLIEALTGMVERVG